MDAERPTYIVSPTVDIEKAVVLFWVFFLATMQPQVDMWHSLSLEDTYFFLPGMQTCYLEVQQPSCNSEEEINTVRMGKLKR